MNEPIYLSEIEILKRFSVMEKHFQRCTGKRYFPSLNFYLNYYDDPITSLKEEAEKMLAFVGLGAYTVKLKVEHLNNAAGLIELTADMYAEITLDIDIYKDIHKSMATLSHEICHKVLFAHGIYFQDPIEIENEIYADLATFYVGFGAFTMKGYSFFNKIRTDTNISRKLDSKSFHFICPKCKSHFVIDNNNGEVLISISQSRNKRYNESTELIRLRGEVNELSEEMEEIKSKWWYKLFKKI